VDRYRNFAELSAHEVEGVDYRIVEVVRPSRVLVLAPHGGRIEPTTSEIAAAIAGENHSLYCFEGLREGRPHGELHITSDRFDEPRARRLAAKARLVVAVHGRLNRDDPEATWLGGLDEALVAFAAGELLRAGFRSISEGHDLLGRSPANICNASLSGMGLQLELPRDLRDRLRDDAGMLESFAAAIRAAIARRLA
jgi:phage replication-related protein YjqB (UPF0714/DUF867 family)